MPALRTRDRPTSSPFGTQDAFDDASERTSWSEFLNEIYPAKAGLPAQATIPMACNPSDLHDAPTQDRIDTNSCAVLIDLQRFHIPRPPNAFILFRRATFWSFNSHGRRLKRLRRWDSRNYAALWKPPTTPVELLKFIQRVARLSFSEPTKRKVPRASRNRKPLRSLESLRQMQSRSSPSATNVNAAEDSSCRINVHENTDEIGDGADDDNKGSDSNDDKATPKPFEQEHPKSTGSSKFSARTNKHMRERRKDIRKHHASNALHSRHVTLPHTYTQNLSEEETVTCDSSSMDDSVLGDSKFFNDNAESDWQFDDDPDAGSDGESVEVNDECDHPPDSERPPQDDRDGDGVRPSTRKNKKLVKAFRKRFPFLPPHVLQRLCNLSSAPRLDANSSLSPGLEPLPSESNSETYVPEFNSDDLWCPLSEDLPPPTMDGSGPHVPSLIDSIMGNSISSSHGGTTNVSVDSGNSYGNVTMKVHNHFNNFCAPPMSWFYSLYFHLMHPLVCIVPAFCTFLPLFPVMWVYP